jgi:hypothetical protein
LRTARDFFCKYIGRRRGGARRRNRSKSHRARRHFPPRDGNGAIFGRTASRSKCVVPDANATAHERFAPSSTAAGTPLGGKVVLEATPRSPGPLGGEGERSRANGAIFGRTAWRRDEIFRREGRSRCRAPNLARGDAPVARVLS